MLRLTLPWSQIIAENVWWVCCLVFMSFRIGPMLRAKRQKVRHNARPAADFILLRTGEVAYGVLPLVYILFKQPSLANYPWFPPNVVIGTLVFAFAIWMIWRAQKELGRSFSSTLELYEQHQLVTHGIYRYIRHPIYAAFLTWGIAAAILLPNWIVGVAGPVVACTLFAVRIPREERMMIEAFGDAYRNYMKSTARLIPGVY